VLKKIEGYPSELLEGELGAELAAVIDDIGVRFLLTKQFEQARDSYLRALEIIQNLTGLEEKQKAMSLQLPGLSC